MKPLLTIIVISALLFNSCKKDPPELQSEFLIPLINTTLGIEHLNGDSLLTVNADQSVSLVYRYPFKKVNLSDIMKIPDTTLLKNITLKSIRLGTRLIETEVTLGQLAHESGPDGDVILKYHGNYLPIPSLSSSSGGVVDFDATNMFESVEVLSGYIEMNVSNGLPIELTDIVFVFRNKISGTVIMSDSISSLMPSALFTQKYDLKGKTFEGLLQTEIINISSPGTGTSAVLIDTNDAIDVQMKITVDTVSAATAIFPAQNLFEMKDNVEYYLNGPLLTFMRIKSGNFKVIVASTLQDSSYIHYELPSAKYMGVEPLVYDIVLPPAPKGDTVYLTQTFPVADYWFDLTGMEGDKFNTYYHVMVMRIDSTGKMMDLSLRDSLYLYYTLYDIVPDYVVGYLGQENDRYIGQTELNLFNVIQNGSLDLEQVGLSLYIENGVGADAMVTVNDLRVKNRKNNAEKQLIATELTTPLNIPRALDNPFRYSYTSTKLSNSNADELIEIFPDILDYDIEFSVNPLGNDLTYKDFIYHSSTIDAGVELDVPLNLMVKGLAFLDTVDFDIQLDANTDNIQSGILSVNVMNKFPVSTLMQLYFLDKDKKLIDSLFKKTVQILPASIEGVSSRVNKAAETKLSAEINESRIEHVKEAKYVVIYAVFDTLPSDRKLKFFSDYFMKVKMNADFKYHTSF